MGNSLSEKVIIRIATEQDLPSIHENELKSYDIPWSVKSLKECFNGQYRVYLMIANGEIIGHLIVQSIVDEFHIHNLCVIPAFQSLGLGHRWLNFLLDDAAKASVISIFLEVRKSNTKAISLYENQGFKPLAVRKNYYKTSTGREDGLVMERLI